MKNYSVIIILSMYALTIYATDSKRGQCAKNAEGLKQQYNAWRNSGLLQRFGRRFEDSKLGEINWLLMEAARQSSPVIDSALGMIVATNAIAVEALRECAQAEEDNKRLKQEVKKLTAHYATLQANGQLWQSDLNALRAKHEGFVSRETDLKKQITESEEREREHRTSWEKLQQEITDLTAQLEQPSSLGATAGNKPGNRNRNKKKRSAATDKKESQSKSGVNDQQVRS